MNTKNNYFFLIMAIALVGSLCAKKDDTNFKGLTFSAPTVFDKETLKLKAQQDVYLPSLREKTELTKSDKKAIRKELEDLIYRKDAKSLNFEELRKAVDLSIKLNWNDKALLYLRQMVAISKDSEIIRTLKLEIADLLFEKGILAKAGEAFEEYLSLYPGSDQSEYAHYKHLLCVFYQTLKTDQDQQPTKQAIQLAESYLEKGLAYKTYRPEIVEIRKHCQLMLYESELNVFNFYMKKKSYGAASGRLAYLKEQYLPKLPNLEPDIITLECKLAQAQGNTEVYKERLAYLNKKFPDFNKTTRVVQAKKRSYTERF